MALEPRRPSGTLSCTEPARNPRRTWPSAGHSVTALLRHNRVPCFLDQPHTKAPRTTHELPEPAQRLPSRSSRPNKTLATTDRYKSSLTTS